MLGQNRGCGEEIMPVGRAEGLDYRTRSIISGTKHAFHTILEDTLPWLRTSMRTWRCQIVWKRARNVRLVATGCAYHHYSVINQQLRIISLITEYSVRTP
jgi:hypothetical protein